jgi:integrase
MATFKAVILNGKAFEKENGTTNIKIRITHKGKQDYVSTKYFVPVSTEKKTYFDNITGLAKGLPEAKFINDQILITISGYVKAEAELGDSANFMTVQQIKRHLKQKKVSKSMDFIAFAETLIESLREAGKTSTADWYDTTVKTIKTFSKSDTLDVLNIDSNYLKLLEVYMLEGSKKTKPERKPMSTGGVNTYMRALRALFNKMKNQYNDEELGIIRIPRNPFKAYKIKTVKRRQQGKYLTVEEMRKIVTYTSTTESLQFARDMFLLMFCLIGINTKDLYYLPKPSGARIEFARFKTDRSYSIRIEKEITAIAAKYQSDTNFIGLHSRYKEYRIFTRQVDRFLKKLMAALGIEKPVSSNWARHTWATIARNNCRIPKDDVALCMGHEDEDNKVTDDYITYDYSIIDRSNRKVLNLIFKS